MPNTPFLALKPSPKIESSRCFLMFSMIASALIRANTISDSMNQQSRCSMLPDEVRLIFAIKSKLHGSLNWSCNLYPRSHLCWLSPKRTEMLHTPWHKWFERNNSSRELSHGHYGGYHLSTWRFKFYRVAPLNNSSRNAELLVLVSFKHFLIGGILQARRWTQVQLNGFVAVVARRYCWPLKISWNQDLVLSRF